MGRKIRSAIIIGATSGIGREVAERLLAQGVRVALAGRRTDILEEIQAKYGHKRVAIATMDVTNASAVEALDRLLCEVEAPDVMLYAAGIGKQNPELDEELEIRTIKTNAEGMVRIVDHFVNYIKHTRAYDSRNKAHIAVITSVAGTKGIGGAPAYSASKSMQSTYLEALAQHARMQHIAVTFGDIRPGFVATELLNPTKHYPMLMTKEAAAGYILRALERRKRILTFDWRFKLVVAFWRMIPRPLWERLTMVKN